MNREIKFRGMDFDDGSWIYGGIDQLGENIIIHGGYGGSIYCKEGTIGQYTGINDKNDKEIYKGDIVNFRGTISDVNFSVIYGSTIKYEDWYGKRDIYLGKVREEVEVIGNIFENPNLLQQKEQSTS